MIARILYFFEKNWEELLKFSRRTQHQLDQWAARYGYKDQPKELLDHAKKSAHAGRYTSVNLTNKNTIEFRIYIFVPPLSVFGETDNGGGPRQRTGHLVARVQAKAHRRIHGVCALLLGKRQGFGTKTSHPQYGPLPEVERSFRPLVNTSVPLSTYLTLTYSN